MPVRWAIINGSPICSVDRMVFLPKRLPFGIMVNGLAVRTNQVNRIEANTAFFTSFQNRFSEDLRQAQNSNDKHRPRCTIQPRKAEGYCGVTPQNKETLSNACTLTFSLSISIIATSTPSTDVPDIKPATRILDFCESPAIWLFVFITISFSTHFRRD